MTANFAKKHKDGDRDWREGVREPSEISKIALQRLAQLGRPRREAPTGQKFFADLRLFLPT
jgi:hypothetical protein